jgi:hypothetical protein
VFATVLWLGVFDPFLRLRVVVLESRVDWIGYFLDCADAICPGTTLGATVKLEENLTYVGVSTAGHLGRKRRARVQAALRGIGSLWMRTPSTPIGQSSTSNDLAAHRLARGDRTSLYPAWMAKGLRVSSTSVVGTRLQDRGMLNRGRWTDSAISRPRRVLYVYSATLCPIAICRPDR